MALYLSPLVDVKEIDLSTTIPAVATSIGVAVLRDTYKGPELKTQLISTVDELIEIFGKPETRSYKDILSATGFLKYGNKLYCTRCMPDGATFGGLYSDAASGATSTAYTSGNAYVLSDFDSEDPDDFHEEMSFGTAPETGTDIAFIAKSRGEWGNNIKVAWMGIDKSTEVRNNSGGTNVTGLSTELWEDAVASDIPLEDNTDLIIFVKVKDQDEDTYDLKETFYVSTNEKKIDDEGKNIFIENVINLESLYVRAAVSESIKNQQVNDVTCLDYQSFAGGINSTDDYATDNVSDANVIEAYELYEDPEDIDVNIFIDSDKSVTVKQRLVEISEARMDAIAVLDCLYVNVVNNKGNETTDLRDFRNLTLNENTSYASLYGNWLNVYDKWGAKYRWIPVSGHVAGIFANTDDVSDPWFAPAGLNRALLTSVRKLAWNPSQGQRDILYKNGINPIVSFAGQGKTIWGQKTLLDKPSAFNRINVRRLFMVLEKAIATAAKYFLFEPNDGFTRLQLVDMIDPFLRDVEARRGIYDYLIVCDGRNNTPERIDRNELWCDIYIKPVRAAEFIVLQFIASKTGASFTELVAATTPE